jgi:hypothetical protein
MTVHVTRFVDRVRGHEAKGSRDFVMSMTDAKDLHADITRLLVELHELRNQLADRQANETITVQLTGGAF